MHQDMLLSTRNIFLDKYLQLNKLMCEGARNQAYAVFSSARLLMWVSVSSNDITEPISFSVYLASFTTTPGSGCQD